MLFQVDQIACTAVVDLHRTRTCSKMTNEPRERASFVMWTAEEEKKKSQNENKTGLKPV